MVTNCYSESIFGEGGELVVYDDDLPEDEEDARHLEEQIGDMEDLRRA